MANNKSEFTIIVRPIIAITLVVLAVGLIGYLTLGRDAEVIQGQVEVTEYRVSGKVPGRIAALYVEEGSRVKAGDTLVKLDAPEVLAKLEQARGAEEAAQAISRKVERGTRQEQVQAALEMWKKSQAGVTIAEKTHRRLKNLYEQGVVPAQKLDEATAQLDASVATEKAARAQYEMARNGAEREDRAAALASVTRAQGAVNEVHSYLNEMVLTVSQLEDLWVTFNVREDLLNNLQMGAVVNAFVPALASKQIQLKVYYLKDQGSYAAWKATKATDQYDLKTFEVKARPTAPVEGLRPGMSVILQR